MKRCRRALVLCLAVGLFVSTPASFAATPDAKSKRAVRLIRQSADTTREEGSARIKAAIDIESDLVSTGFTLDGVISLGAEGAGQLTMHSDAALFGTPLDLEMRFVDGAVYMNFAGLFAAVGGEDVPPDLLTRPWLSIDVSELADASAQGAAPPGSSNPAGGLEALRGITRGSIETVGEEAIDGVPTTHYRGVVDLARAIERVPEEFREQLDQTLLQSELSDVPVDVWIDDDGRVRRQRLALELEVEGETLRETVELSFLDFGVPVEVAAPATDEVIPFEEFLALVLAVDEEQLEVDA